MGMPTRRGNASLPRQNRSREVMIMNGEDIGIHAWDHQPCGHATVIIIPACAQMLFEVDDFQIDYKFGATHSVILPGLFCACL